MSDKVMSNSSRSPSTWIAALIILVLQVVVYCLVYSGRFNVDDEHILAARTISLAADRQINDDRVMGNSRVFALSQLPEAATNIEPAQTLLGVPLVWIANAAHFGQVQTLFVMNIWVTALTTMVVFLTVMIQGYSISMGVILAGLFGLCTIAFPYSRTYFRDPLAMFFLACAWMFMSAIIRKHDETARKLRDISLWVGLVLSTAAGILTKNTILIAVPVISIELVTHFWSGGLVSNLKKMITNWKTWVLILIVGIASCLFWFLIVPTSSILARFAPSYYAYLARFFFTSPHRYLLEALSGPFISPGKSILIFSPILILSLWSLIFKFKRSWTAWAYLVLLAIFQALFYDREWSGHIHWGPRFLLPTIPLLILTLAPVVQKLVGKALGRIGLFAIALLSFLVQLIGALSPVSKYYEETLASTPPVTELATVWNYKYSIIGWGAKWILEGNPVDIALARMQSQWIYIVPPMIFILLLAGLSLFAKSQRSLAYTALIFCLVLNGIMLFSLKKDPNYGFDRKDLKAAQAMLIKKLQSGDSVLVKSYGTPAWDYWMNWTSPGIQWTSLPYYFPSPALIEEFRNSQDPDVAMDEISRTILTKVTQPGRTVWLVLPSDSPGADLGIEKAWLESRSTDSSCSVFSNDEKKTELCQYRIK